MPNYPIPNGFAAIAIVFKRTGMTQEVVTTFGVALKASPTAAGIALDVKNAWTAAGSMNGGQPPNLPAIRVEFAATFGGVFSQGSAAPGWTAGGGAATLLTPANAMLAKKVSGVSGRANKGRMFLPWVYAADVDTTGTILAARVTAWNGGLAALLTALGAAGRSQINGMKILHKDGSTPRAVTSLVLRNKVATQRPRQPTH